MSDHGTPEETRAFFLDQAARADAAAASQRDYARHLRTASDRSVAIGRARAWENLARESRRRAEEAT